MVKPATAFEALGLKDIVGHSDRVGDLKEGIQKKSFSGAYLFCGPKGVGKYTLAKVLSRFIICPGLREDFCACETCANFPDIPDYMEVKLPLDKDVISTECLEPVQSFLSLYPFNGEKRVLVVDDADRLTQAAANEFLKTTEDIRPYNIILFITSRPGDIIPTLRSRLKSVYFGNLPTEDVLTLLKKRGVNSGRLREIGGVAPYLSQSLLTDVDMYLEQQTEAFNFVKGFGKKKEEDVLKRLDEIAEAGQLVHFTEMLVVVLTDFLKLYYDCVDYITNTSKVEIFEDIYKTWSTDLLFVSIETLRGVLDNKGHTSAAGMKHRVKTAISMIYLRAHIWK